MKQLTCEMCGSTELVKQDGFFVCQTCGCKYSVEEAKKMMIEGTVDVQGTVKVDNSAFVEKYLANARRAMQKEDWEETEKYYNMVEQNDPSNIEAIFYSAYGKARLSMVESDIYKRQQICDVFCKSISIIDDNYNVDKSEENQEVIAKMHDSLFEMYGTSFVYTTKTDGYGFKTDNRGETYYLFAKMAFAFIDSLTNIIEVDDQLIYWKMIYQQRKYLVDNTGLTENARNRNREIAISVGNKIREKDPNFTVDIVPARTAEPIQTNSRCENRKSVFSKILITGISILIFGAFMFLVLGESRYFMKYVMLSGYYSSINTLFVLDYICIAIGAIGTLTSAKTSGKKISIATILGIVGFVFAWLFAIIGHGAAIAGIVLGVKENKETGNKKALIICIFAEVCAVLSSLLGIFG